MEGANFEALSGYEKIRIIGDECFSNHFDGFEVKSSCYVACNHFTQQASTSKLNAKLVTGIRHRLASKRSRCRYIQKGLSFSRDHSSRKGHFYLDLNHGSSGFQRDRTHARFRTEESIKRDGRTNYSQLGSLVKG
ncbi:hypothetical protein G5I_04601 [Acromyrmex echinatior]|uniref:Uncharacterized protein n=1 Tax=Acromyrmex echinatior TaxID=103372 RepID=F4WG29_ACREC|nr:hypothetical protein G5I_04601 [Acromyrmex echinatior]